jgi:hypothetical protein
MREELPRAHLSVLGKREPMKYDPPEKTATILPFPKSNKFREELLALVEKYGGKETEDVIHDLRYTLAFFEAKRISGR